MNTSEVVRSCDRCGEGEVKLRRVVVSSGATFFAWWCLSCDENARKQGQWVSHVLVNDWFGRGLFNGLESLDDLPIVRNYASKCHCAVCGKPGAELHHFAPQALAEYFGDDWTAWPTAYLCTGHHRQWHDIVTPYMPGRHNLELAGRVLTKWNGGDQ